MNEYKDGIRWNGKGKEFNPPKVEFEGEYFEEQRWNGKIKIEILESYITYEGELLNGKKHGKGKEWSDDNKLLYEGEFINGQRLEEYKKNSNK